MRLGTTTLSVTQPGRRRLLPFPAAEVVAEVVEVVAVVAVVVEVVAEAAWR